MNAVLLLLAPLVGWLSLFAQVHVYWGEGSYYSYGWAVPFLALALATRRLRDLGLEEKVGQISRFHVAGFMGILLVLTPLRLIAEPDPYWRLPLWGQAFVLIALTLIALRMVLGKSVIRSFLFPCLFPLTALPWPTGARFWQCCRTHIARCRRARDTEVVDAAGAETRGAPAAISHRATARAACGHPTPHHPPIRSG